tara:strand:- start:901 stop:1356 length:456 start_codon:yes stop_codon:yes gene_type:complete
MEQSFRQWIGTHRAMIAWFHSAHHVTKGIGFAGDHVSLYGKIYLKLEEDFDSIVEKGIGLSGDETLADPMSIFSLAANLLGQYPQASNKCAEEIARCAFDLMTNYVKYLDQIYSQFDSSGCLTLGLDDHISGLANQYEAFQYLLQQRTRGS